VLEGIDVSAHQATLPSLKGLSFVVCRATYGMSPDATYAKHAAAVRNAGLELGSYHFGRNQPVGPQVAMFLKTAAKEPPDFFALDLEADGANSPMTQAQAKAFIEAVQTAVGGCGLYHSTSGYPDLGQTFRWVADYRGKPPPIAWDLWQYTSAGHLDRDRFDGTLADFQSVTRGQSASPNLPGDDMTTFPAYDDPHLVDLPAGTKLYDSSDLAAVRETLGAARTLPYLGSWTPPGKPVAHIVVHGAVAEYLKASDMPKPPYLRPDPVPPPADCTNEVAAEHERTRQAAIGAVSLI
jgi:hypothetical protein